MRDQRWRQTVAHDQEGGHRHPAVHAQVQLRMKPRIIEVEESEEVEQVEYCEEVDQAEESFL